MRYLYILILLILFSCNTKRELQLPEIQNAKVTEIFDVSPAYIFYDETQPDSTFFNRTNLIGTTNWLVNVDKRLTLEQAIPHIQYLQNKRKKAGMHKNENAKNYFTCNDTSIKNLGFLEFTEVEYNFLENTNEVLKTDNDKNLKLLVTITSDETIFISDIISGTRIARNEFSFEDLRKKELSKFMSSNYSKSLLLFDKDISFQDYIFIKSKLANILTDKIKFAKNEYFY